MQPPRPRLTAMACGAILAALAAGCRTAAPSPVVRRPSVEEDLCAERLHDLSGAILFYYAAHHRLPESPAVLASLGPEDPVPLVCPLSDQPYLYHPTGLRVQGQPGRMVLYDAVACHTGMRWGVFVDGGGTGRRLIARVVLVADAAVIAAEQRAAVAAAEAQPPADAPPAPADAPAE